MQLQPRCINGGPYHFRWLVSHLFVMSLFLGVAKKYILLAWAGAEANSKRCSNHWSQCLARSRTRSISDSLNISTRFYFIYIEILYSMIPWYRCQQCFILHPQKAPHPFQSICLQKLKTSCCSASSGQLHKSYLFFFDHFSLDWWLHFVSINYLPCPSVGETCSPFVRQSTLNLSHYIHAEFY